MKLGICVGTVTDELAQLGASWAYGVAQNALSDEFRNLPPNVEFVPLTFESEPNAEWERFATWHNYSGYWLIGNEPHTNWDGNKTAAQVAPIFERQMDYILNLDPNAKCIVTVSTQGQTPYNPHHPDENFIGDLWNCFSPLTRAKVAGFHMHLYPRWVSDNLTERWQVKNLVAYVRRMKKWMALQNVDDRELWLSEMGYEGYLAQDQYKDCVVYLDKLLHHKYLNENLARFAFYVATERSGAGGTNGYLPLLDERGQLTGLGAVYVLRAAEDLPNV